MKRITAYIVFSSFLCTSYISCIQKHMFTSKLTNCNLYVEVYNVNPAGVDADYLTDSSNFKVYVGRFEEEHERYTYKCKGDSIYIVKTENGSKNCQQVTLPDGKWTIHCDIDTIEMKVFSLAKLRTEHSFE